MKPYQIWGRYVPVTVLEQEAQNGSALLDSNPKRIQLDGTESLAEIVTKRLEVCRACEHLVKGHLILPQMEFLKCGICGCPVRSKTMLTRSTCPKGYW